MLWPSIQRSHRKDSSFFGVLLYPTFADDNDNDNDNDDYNVRPFAFWAHSTAAKIALTTKWKMCSNPNGSDTNVDWNRTFRIYVLRNGTKRANVLSMCRDYLVFVRVLFLLHVQIGFGILLCALFRLSMIHFFHLFFCFGRCCLLVRFTFVCAYRYLIANPNKELHWIFDFLTWNTEIFEKKRNRNTHQQSSGKSPFIPNWYWPGTFHI